MKPKREHLSAETAKLLGDLATLLDVCANGKKLERFQAVAYRDVIRRILKKPPAPRFTAAQSREIRIALDYAIRRELSPRTNRKAALAATAKAHGATDQSVDQLKSEWKRYVEISLVRLESNVEYDGLTRKEKLERELAALQTD